MSLFTASDLIKSLLPVVAGSILTLAATMLTLSYNADTQQQAQLRAAYSTFLVAADEANEGMGATYRDQAAVFFKYFARRRFLVGPLGHADSVALETHRQRGRDLVARLRKTSFDLLLLEPSDDRRERVREYVSQFLDSKLRIDKEVSRVKAFVETGNYQPEPGSHAASPEGEDNVLGALYDASNATRASQNKAYNKFVSYVLEDDRWH